MVEEENKKDEINTNEDVTTEQIESEEKLKEQEETEQEIENQEAENQEIEQQEYDEKENNIPKERKGFFKKKKDKKDEKIEELNDKLIRNMAEFDNFRKRSEKEKSQMFEIGAKSIIERILPVVDSFERGLLALTEEDKESAFAQGIEKIYKQLITALEEAGVKQIEAVGKEFDPNFHNAVMHAEDENFGENIISDEFQKGYMYKDLVVRHSMVKVVN